MLIDNMGSILSLLALLLMLPLEVACYVYLILYKINVCVASTSTLQMTLYETEG